MDLHNSYSQNFESSSLRHIAAAGRASFDAARLPNHRGNWTASTDIHLIFRRRARHADALRGTSTGRIRATRQERAPVQSLLSGGNGAPGDGCRRGPRRHPRPARGRKNRLGSIKSRRRSKRIPALRLGIERVLMSPDPRVTNPAPASPPGGITGHGRMYYSEVVYTIIYELSVVYWIIRVDYVYFGAGRDFFLPRSVRTGRKGALSKKPSPGCDGSVVDRPPRPSDEGRPRGCRAVIGRTDRGAVSGPGPGPRHSRKERRSALKPHPSRPGERVPARDAPGYAGVVTNPLSV